MRGGPHRPFHRRQIVGGQDHQIAQHAIGDRDVRPRVAWAERVDMTTGRPVWSAETKAALDKMVEAWRAEHPTIGFTRVVVGDCAGGEGDSVTEFANNWDPNVVGEFYPIWASRGRG